MPRIEQTLLFDRYGLPTSALALPKLREALANEEHRGEDREVA
jgi:hypothetical protein